MMHLIDVRVVSILIVPVTYVIKEQKMKRTSEMKVIKNTIYIKMWVDKNGRIYLQRKRQSKKELK